jgi:hypothetical protein
MYNHIEVIQMNTSSFIDTIATANMTPYVISTTRKSTGLKSIDQLISRHTISLATQEGLLAENPFQKSLVLYGQDQRLDYMKLPPCMYMIIAAASTDEKFTIHRFYLPYKNGIRFATYLLNAEGEVIESVCYQRNAKYLAAFKVIRAEINMAANMQEEIAA